MSDTVRITVLLISLVQKSKVSGDGSQLVHSVIFSMILVVCTVFFAAFMAMMTAFFVHFNVKPYGEVVGMVAIGI
jgi:hypothetical protein